MTSMRFAILLLATALGASGEFRQVVVDFEGTGCVSCAESLPGRLGRVRGVEKADVDLDHNRLTIGLAAGNKTRLGPLLSRITQDGTKIRRVEALVRGRIIEAGATPGFQPSGLTETYLLEPAADASKVAPQEDVLYEVRGVVSRIEPGADAVIAVQSIEAIPSEKQ